MPEEGEKQTPSPAATQRSGGSPPSAPAPGKKKRARRRPRRKRRSVPENNEAAASPPAPEEFQGESLGTCSEKEWEGGEAAYSPALINLKKKQNRVTVFARTKKVNKSSASPKSPKSPGTPKSERRRLKPVRSPSKRSPKSTEDRADVIGRIVAGVVRKFLQGKKDDVQVEIRLTASDGKPVTVVS